MSGDVDALRDWLLGIEGRAVLVKRLSANDTGLTGGHQVGFYVPRSVALTVAPELGEPVLNPRRPLRFELRSHGQAAEPKLIYYNSRPIGQQANGRDEFRVTGFGGRRSALQDPDSTGAILVTAWDDEGAVEAWLARSVAEEDTVEAAIGPVEPGTQVVRLAGGEIHDVALTAHSTSCEPDIAELPRSWVNTFPTGRELADEAARRRPGGGETVDQRVVHRYGCEFGLFQIVETAHTLPLVTAGFSSVDAFLIVAQSVANRRKSRAGRSLELHLARIFDEEGIEYDAGASTEGGRTPDFVFPSIHAYREGRPTRMLGVKTTVKDRWRQVLDEAARIREKHLFTLAEGVSSDQFAQMEEAGVRLVVPASNVTRFPAEVRPRLLTLADFVGIVTTH